MLATGQRTAEKFVQDSVTAAGGHACKMQILAIPVLSAAARAAQKFVLWLLRFTVLAGDPRATATAVALLAAILVLIPIPPELASEMGVGPLFL